MRRLSANESMAAFSRACSIAGRVARLTLALVGAVLTTSACWVFPPAVHEVSPAVLQDVRGIGVVQGEASHEIADDATDIINVFVIDIGSASVGRIEEKAKNLLRKRGWEILPGGQPGLEAMVNDKRDAFLTAYEFHPYPLSQHPELYNGIKEKSTKTDGLVIVKVEVYHG